MINRDKTKTKVKRYNFAFTKEIDELLRLIGEKTELSYTVIVKQGIEAVAKERGISL
jgi:hypothetical protein